MSTERYVGSEPKDVKYLRSYHHGNSGPSRISVNSIFVLKKGETSVSKKRKSSGKEYIKNPKFKDRNISSLEAHPREGSRLRSPYSVLKNMNFSRPWVDQCVPNILWACILATCMDRKEYLQLFRLVVTDTREQLETAKELHVTHNFLATATEQEFDTMFGAVLRNESAKSHLAALLLVSTFPDLHHWQRCLQEPDRSSGLKTLARAVGESFDHQSQISTDVRWLKVMSQIIIRQRVMFGPGFEEQIEEYRLYPDKGDMRKVRPSIRALEVGLRENEFFTDSDGKPQADLPRQLPADYAEDFWREMRGTTGCFPADTAKKPKAGDPEVMGEIVDILRDLERHFHATEITTATDPRHDGAFGIVAYALHLLVHAVSTPAHSRVEGRIILRTIVEAFITFSYLAKKDDATIWLQYRSAGSGQIKLAFLKNIREEDAPGFVDLSILEGLANEDRWMEFQDIPLGHWANLNLRKIAEEAGVKDVYDRYYDWSSNYTHSQWGAVRDAAFTTCLNPLHRFHRIPTFMKGDMPSIISDCCKILNRMLDELNQLYPAFKPRIKAHKSSKIPDAEEVTESMTSD